eukprot:15452513-Alexandrium_andersonii.AAC.1
MFTVSSCSLRPVFVESGLFTVSGLFVACSQGYANEHAAQRTFRRVFVASGCVRHYVGALAAYG